MFLRIYFVMVVMTLMFLGLVSCSPDKPDGGKQQVVDDWTVENPTVRTPGGKDKVKALNDLLAEEISANSILEFSSLQDVKNKLRVQTECRRDKVISQQDLEFHDQDKIPLLALLPLESLVQFESDDPSLVCHFKFTAENPLGSTHQFTAPNVKIMDLRSVPTLNLWKDLLPIKDPTQTILAEELPRLRTDLWLQENGNIQVVCEKFRRTMKYRAGHLPLAEMLLETFSEGADSRLQFPEQVCQFIIRQNDVSYTTTLSPQFTVRFPLPQPQVIQSSVQIDGYQGFPIGRQNAYVLVLGNPYDIPMHLAFHASGGVSLQAVWSGPPSHHAQTEFLGTVGSHFFEEPIQWRVPGQTVRAAGDLMFFTIPPQSRVSIVGSIDSNRNCERPTSGVILYGFMAKLTGDVQLLMSYHPERWQQAAARGERGDAFQIFEVQRAYLDYRWQPWRNGYNHGIYQDFFASSRAEGHVGIPETVPCR